jgi:hypothetical protein
MNMMGIIRLNMVHHIGRIVQTCMCLVGIEGRGCIVQTCMCLVGIQGKGLICTIGGDSKLHS